MWSIWAPHWWNSVPEPRLWPGGGCCQHHLPVCQSPSSLYCPSTFFLPRMPCNPILLWCTWISFGGPNRSSWCQISALPIRAISVWWCWHSSILHVFLLHLIPKDDLQSQGVPNLLQVSKSLLWQRVIFVCKMYPAFSIKENLQLL